MKRTEAQIHQTELLIALDYLLNYTDKDHPATYESICEHARNFGLKYNKKETKGNDVRRQRIADCLHFLQHICYKFENTDKIPFVINTTESGKFYIEEKNRLNVDQIIKILAAVKNDKYIKKEDTDLLLNKLLNLLCNKNNSDFFKYNLEKEDKNVKKISNEINKKMRLIQKALDENKCVPIIKQSSRTTEIKQNRNEDRANKNKSKSKFLFEFYDEKVYCRVYQIKEYDNKPYVILLPLKKNGIIFDSLENLNIPINLSEREILMSDAFENKDLNELFIANNPFLGRYYKSLDNYINDQIKPNRGFAFKTSFYFKHQHLSIIKRSFEEYFSFEMPVIQCSSFKIKEEAINNLRRTIELPRKIDQYALEASTNLDNRTSPLFGIVNITINKESFISWLYENPSIANIVNVVAPVSVNDELGKRFLNTACKYLKEEEIKDTLKKYKKLYINK